MWKSACCYHLTQQMVLNDPNVESKEILCCLLIYYVAIESQTLGSIEHLGPRIFWAGVRGHLGGLADEAAAYFSGPLTVDSD